LGGYGAAWTDTAQFNYWNPDLVQHRIQVLLTIASLADAVRCDVAYLVLNDQIQANWGTQLGSWDWQRPQEEFWSVAISFVKSHYPDFIFMGEVYAPNQATLQQLGFDYTYDKSLLDNLAGFNLPTIQNYISSNSPQFHQHSAHFLSNHDEPRAVPKFGQWYLADAAALVTYTLPGLRFFWMWDDLGYSNKLVIQLRREEEESINQSVQDFYGQFRTILKTHSSFRNGTWELLPVSQQQGGAPLMAWKWVNEEEKILCVLNFSPNDASGAIVLSDASSQNGSDMIPITELLTGTVYNRSVSQMRSTGLEVVVNSWFAQIFLYYP